MNLASVRFRRTDTLQVSVELDLSGSVNFVEGEIEEDGYLTVYVWSDDGQFESQSIWVTVDEDADECFA